MEVTTVQDIMMEFAVNTGLQDKTTSPRRYLWTDSFAVTAFLELYRQTHNDKYLHLALGLIEQVHSTLGKHRPDDKEKRAGWISGLDEGEGRVNPTKGGLRIGKELPERPPNEPYDEDQEWDRDGQYFHYLTKWMHALCQASSATGDPQYIAMAVTLAKTVHTRFTYTQRGVKRMYWKMSIDLSHPLVPSMGHHDPLDGYLTYYTIQSCLAKASVTSLQEEMAELYSIVRDQDLSTSDPLGLGRLLCDVYRVVQLMCRMKPGEADPFLQTLLDKLLLDSLSGLKTYNPKRLEAPAKYRLAFREFGLSIGLQAIKKTKESLIERSAAHLSTKYLSIFGW